MTSRKGRSRRWSLDPIRYGLIYDYLDSLVLITIAHGVLNVFLFAVCRIQGSFLSP